MFKDSLRSIERLKEYAPSINSIQNWIKKYASVDINFRRQFTKKQSLYIITCNPFLSV